MDPAVVLAAVASAIKVQPANVPEARGAPGQSRLGQIPRLSCFPHPPLVVRPPPLASHNSSPRLATSLELSRH
jgi:hypothetical protein